MRLLISDTLIILVLQIVTIGVNGGVRLPTVFGQVHAASKVAFLGISSLLAAAAVQGDGSTVARAVLIIALLAITTPVSAHVIARAAYKREQRGEEG
jgi:multicomponent Na+:H+ antiporter subunit G